MYFIIFNYVYICRSECEYVHVSVNALKGQKH